MLSLSRLENIQNDVSRVLELLGDGFRFREDRNTPTVPEITAYKHNNMNIPNINGNNNNNSLVVGINNVGSSAGTINKTSATAAAIAAANSTAAHFGFCSHSYITSPFNAFGTLVNPEQVPPPIQRLINPQMAYIKENVISMGLLTRDQTIRILSTYVLLLLFFI